MAFFCGYLTRYLNRSLNPFFRSRMGVLQPGHICVHAVRWRPPQHGRTHQQGEAPEAGPLGGLTGGADAGDRQQRRSCTLRGQSSAMLPEAAG